MGYILPITQFEHKDYQSRLIEDKQELRPVGKSYKVLLDMEQKSDYDREIKYELTKDKKQLSRKTTITSDQIKQDPDPLHAKITGKGSLFHEMV